MAIENMKDIKRRIKSVKNTMQITKAMELVASSKLKKAKKRADQTKAFFNILYETMEDIAINNTDFSSPFTALKKVSSALYIIISGDRGLAGGYNVNIFKYFASIQNKKIDNKILAIGKKGYDHFSKNNFYITESFNDILEDIDISDAQAISNIIIEGYLRGDYQEVFIVYTQLISPIEQIPNILKLLPLNIDNDNKKEGIKKAGKYIEYDPSPEEVFNLIVPEYLAGIIFGASVESFASEQSARRMAMETASDNAKEMIDGLSLKYNRARQAAITQEISEIVAGAAGSN